MGYPLDPILGWFMMVCLALCVYVIIVDVRDK